MSLTDGIVGCWSPSLGASGYRLLDRSGRGNHGTFSGMTVSDWQASSPGWCVSGDGVDNRIDTALRLPTSNMTYGGWVNVRSFASFPANRPFGEANSASGTSGTSILLTSGGPYVVIRGGSAGNIDARTIGTTNTGEWYLWVVVLGWRPELYKNGVLLASATGTTIASYNQGFRILNDDSASPTFGVNGLVGEVFVWNRPLGSAEIYDLYRRGNGAIGRALTGQTRRRTYGFVAATGARRRRILCGDYS